MATISAVHWRVAFLYSGVLAMLGTAVAPPLPPPLSWKVSLSSSLKDRRARKGDGLETADEDVAVAMAAARAAAAAAAAAGRIGVVGGAAAWRKRCSSASASS